MKSITWIQERKKYVTYNKKKNTIWIGQILRSNCLIKHVIEGKKWEG